MHETNITLVSKNNYEGAVSTHISISVQETLVSKNSSEGAAMCLCRTRNFTWKKGRFSMEYADIINMVNRRSPRQRQSWSPNTFSHVTTNNSQTTFSDFLGVCASTFSLYSRWGCEEAGRVPQISFSFFVDGGCEGREREDGEIPREGAYIPGCREKERFLGVIFYFILNQNLRKGGVLIKIWERREIF